MGKPNLKGCEGMQKRKVTAIKDTYLLAMAVMGWIFIASEFHNFYNLLGIIAGAGLAPQPQYVLYAIFQAGFFGILSIAFPAVLVMDALDAWKEAKQ
jgi:hypothetical protein